MGVDLERDYVAANERSLARLKQFIAERSAEDLLRPISDGWTVTAYLGHLAFWDRRVSRLVDRWLREGYKVPTCDAHIINDAMKPSLLLVQPAEAAREALSAAEEADHVVKTLPETLLSQIRSGSGLTVNREHHRNLHLDEFEAFFG